MDVIVRSNNNPVNDMTTHVSWLINNLDKVIKNKIRHSVWLVTVMDCQSGYSYHQQDNGFQIKTCFCLMSFRRSDCLFALFIVLST